MNSPWEKWVEDGQRNIYWFEAYFGSFTLWGAPKHRLGSPMAPNGQASMQWEVEIKYFTMGLFHYGKTERCSDERWLEACFGRFQGLRVTQGPLRVPNWQPIVTLDVKIKYLTMGRFYYGKTVCCLCERWKEECLMIRDMFWQFSESEGPVQGSPMFPNWQPSVPWKVELKYLMGGFHYRKTECCLH